MTAGAPWFPTDVTEWRTRCFLTLLMTGVNWKLPTGLGCLPHPEGSRVCEPPWTSGKHKDGNRVHCGPGEENHGGNHWERGRYRWMKSRVPLVPVFSRSNIELSACLSGSGMNTLRGEVPTLCAALFSEAGWHDIQIVFHCLIVALADTRKRLFYLNLFIFPLCYRLGCCLRNGEDWKET